MKRPDRQRIAGEQPHERGGQAEAERLEDHHLHDLRAPRAEQAQVGDRVAALGDRQEHRVEREQEAQQRADRGEEVARLVARVAAPGAAARRLGRLARPRFPRPASARSSARTAASRPGLRLHEDPRDFARQPARAPAGARAPSPPPVRSPSAPNVFGTQHGGDGQRRDASAQLAADDPLGDASDRAPARYGQLRPIPLAERVASGIVWASPSSSARLSVGAGESAPSARRPFGPTTLAVCSSSGAAWLTPGSASTRASSLRRSRREPRARSCRFAGPITAWTTSVAEPAMLPSATVTSRTRAPRRSRRRGRRAAPGRRARAAAAGRGRQQRVGSHQRPRPRGFGGGQRSTSRR